MKNQPLLKALFVKALKKAIAVAPRGRRAVDLLNITAAWLVMVQGYRDVQSDNGSEVS